MRRLPRRVVLSEILLCFLKSKPQTIDGLAAGIIHQPPVDLALLHLLYSIIELTDVSLLYAI